MKGRIISTDRLYTSIPLAKWLLSCDFTTVGTIKSNRVGIPSEIKEVSGRENFSSKFFLEATEKKLVLGSYVCSPSKGKKNVLLLCTMPPLLAVTKDDKKKPTIYQFYDFTNGGTDIVDQRRGVYSTKTKSRKWTWNAFSYLLDRARVNSSTILALASKQDPRKQNSFEYGWNLVTQLTTPFIKERNILPLKTAVKNKIHIIFGTTNNPATDMEYSSKATKRRRCSGCVQGLRNTSAFSKKLTALLTSDRQCQRCASPCWKVHSYLCCENCK